MDEKGEKNKGDKEKKIVYNGELTDDEMREIIAGKRTDTGDPRSGIRKKILRDPEIYDNQKKIVDALKQIFAKIDSPIVNIVLRGGISVDGKFKVECSARTRLGAEFVFPEK